jgi:hypothetical protein
MSIHSTIIFYLPPPEDLFLPDILLLLMLGQRSPEFSDDPGNEGLLII